MHRLVLELLPLAALLPVVAAQSPRADIMAGVGTIAAPGHPGSLCVFGPAAYVLATAKTRSGTRLPVVAAAEHGAGRVVVFTHPRYLQRAYVNVGDTRRLLRNSLEWVCGGKLEGVRVATNVQIELVQDLGLRGLTVSRGSGAVPWATGADVVILNGLKSLSPAAVRELRAYVKNGGRLITAALGWGWQVTHPNLDVRTDHPGSALLLPMGIALGLERFIRPPGRGFPIALMPAQLVHARRCYLALLDGRLSARQTAQAEAVLASALSALPHDEPLLMAWMNEQLAERGRDVIPTAASPTLTGSGADRLAVIHADRVWRRQPPTEVRALPCASDFPGPVPASCRPTTARVQIPRNVTGWHSTGLYAPPGQVVQVTGLAEGTGWRLRIGCHTEHLDPSMAWMRWPRVDISRPLPSKEGFASALGGLVYIDVGEFSSPIDVDLTVFGAVESPLFLTGATPRNEWRAQLSGRKTPWGELVGKRVILTLPRAILTELSDPQEVLDFWDQIVDATVELAGCAPPRCPERFVVDRQLTGGQMRAGYPGVLSVENAGWILDVESLRKRGTWHGARMLGIRRQGRNWPRALPFTGPLVEVRTAAGRDRRLRLPREAAGLHDALFAVYVMDRLLSLPDARIRELVMKEFRLARRAGGVAVPAAGGRHQDKPALFMYMELQRHFGWEIFKRTFRELRAWSKEKSSIGWAERRDEWCRRFSRAAGYDLSSFFRAWGFPVSDAATTDLADLKDWTGKAP